MGERYLQWVHPGKFPTAGAYVLDLHLDWCVVHRCVFDEQFGCHWDRLAGPRPGRGECSVVGAVVVQKEEA